MSVAPVLYVQQIRLLLLFSTSNMSVCCSCLLRPTLCLLIQPSTSSKYVCCSCPLRPTSLSVAPVFYVQRVCLLLQPSTSNKYVCCSCLLRPTSMSVAPAFYVQQVCLLLLTSRSNMYVLSTHISPRVFDCARTASTLRNFLQNIVLSHKPEI